MSTDRASVSIGVDAFDGRSSSQQSSPWTYLSSLLDELLGHVGKVFDHVFGHFRRRIQEGMYMVRLRGGFGLLDGIPDQDIYSSCDMVL